MGTTGVLFQINLSSVKDINKDFLILCHRGWIYHGIFGLSKERPILDHHAKAHIHEIRRISCGFHLKSGRFHVKSTYKTYKSNISRKTLQFYGVLWEGYVMFSHEIRRIS